MNIKCGLVIIALLLAFIGGELFVLHLQNEKYFKEIPPVQSYLNYSKLEDDLLEEDSNLEENIDNSLEEEVPKKINLMIVAHPDDETLWGGIELLNENYLVLCITNGKLSGNIRYKEMNKVMEKTNDKCIILSYPDAYKLKRVNWEKVGVSKYIKSDIETVITYKHWKKIVTHNPQGEYGHIHHKLTSKFTTELYNKDINQDNLYYFAKYYDKGHLYKVRKYLPKLTEEQVEKKMDLLDIYASQSGAFVKYGQMIKYEKLVKAKDFKNSI